MGRVHEGRRPSASACLLVVGLAVVGGCAAPVSELAGHSGGADTDLPVADTDLLRAEVESYELVDIGGLNERIEAGIESGADWPTSPLAATIELLGGDTDTRRLSVTERKNRGEGADTTVVVIVRDGFLDDSIRGDWHRIVYVRQPDMTWRVREARRAFRCWRGHHLTSFSESWCL
jgi:hypothetical protein